MTITQINLYIKYKAKGNSHREIYICLELCNSQYQKLKMNKETRCIAVLDSQVKEQDHRMIPFPSSAPFHPSTIQPIGIVGVC